MTEEFNSNKNINDDPREFNLMVDNIPYRTSLIDLPCIIETQKTYSKQLYFKCGDISQMLIVRDLHQTNDPLSSMVDVPSTKNNDSEHSNAENNETNAAESYKCNSGISPAAQSIRERWSNTRPVCHCPNTDGKKNIFKMCDKCHAIPYELISRVSLELFNRMHENTSEEWELIEYEVEIEVTDDENESEQEMDIDQNEIEIQKNENEKSDVNEWDMNVSEDEKKVDIDTKTDDDEIQQRPRSQPLVFRERVKSTQVLKPKLKSMKVDSHSIVSNITPPSVQRTITSASISSNNMLPSVTHSTFERKRNKKQNKKMEYFSVTSADANSKSMSNSKVIEMQKGYGVKLFKNVKNDVEKQLQILRNRLIVEKSNHEQQKNKIIRAKTMKKIEKLKYQIQVLESKNK